MEHVYGAFGLTIVSNVELPGLSPPAGDGKRVVVHVAPPVDRTGAGRAAPAFSAGLETMWRFDDGWLLRYEDPRDGESWTMQIAAGGAIDVARTRGILLHDLVEILKSIGLAGALQLQGTLLLHGCAAEVAGRAVLVLGAAGAGKSTIAAAFVRRGFALISDDIAVVEPIDGVLGVHPGPPRLRITPNTASALGWDPDTLPRVFATALLGDKRHVELSANERSFCPESRELAAIFVLGPRTKAPVSTIESVSPGRAIGLLRANGYRDFLLDRVQRAARFPLIARLASEVPVHIVRAPDDHGALPGVIESLSSEVAPTGFEPVLPPM